MPNNNIEIPKPPKTMWPLDFAIVQSLPPELRPDTEALAEIRYPWEFLTLLRDTMAERITEDRGIDQVRFDNEQTNTIKGPVWYSEDVVIRSGAEIDGPAYIGPGVHVGFQSLIRGRSLLLAGSLVGGFSEIKGSILGPDANAPHRSTVLDSFISEGVSLSSMTTANYRLDGGHINAHVDGELVDTGLTHLGMIVGPRATFGGDVFTMPGVLIGAESEIFTRSMVDRNLPDRMSWVPPRVAPEIRPVRRGR